LRLEAPGARLAPSDYLEYPRTQERHLNAILGMRYEHCRPAGTCVNSVDQVDVLAGKLTESGQARLRNESAIYFVFSCPRQMPRKGRIQLHEFLNLAPKCSYIIQFGIALQARIDIF
jgi:hypothetical protein